MRKFWFSLRRRGGWRKSLASLYCLSAVMLGIVLLCSGCGGGGGDSPPPEAAGTIIVNARLTEPAGVTDFSGISISVAGGGSTYTVTTKDVSGKSTFSGLKITDATKGTTYNVTASKTDYTTATRAIVLLKDGDQQTADISLQFSASKITAQAWTEFSAGTPAGYTSALADFKTAATRAVTAQEISESNTGLGWTYYLGFASYDSAVNSFLTASGADSTNMDAKVGQAFALVDKVNASGILGDLDQAIPLLEQVPASPSYSFSKAPRFNSTSIYATLAYAYSQKYLKTGSGTDKSKACSNASSVPKGAAECTTACAAVGLTGTCGTLLCSCP